MLEQCRVISSILHSIEVKLVYWKGVAFWIEHIKIYNRKRSIIVKNFTWFYQCLVFYIRAWACIPISLLYLSGFYSILCASLNNYRDTPSVTMLRKIRGCDCPISSEADGLGKDRDSRFTWRRFPMPNRAEGSISLNVTPLNQNLACELQYKGILPTPFLLLSVLGQGLSAFGQVLSPFGQVSTAFGWLSSVFGRRLFPFRSPFFADSLQWIFFWWPVHTNYRRFSLLYTILHTFQYYACLIGAQICAHVDESLRWSVPSHNFTNPESSLSFVTRTLGPNVYKWEVQKTFLIIYRYNDIQLW